MLSSSLFISFRMLLLYTAEAAAAAAAKKALEDGVCFVPPFGFVIKIMVVTTAANIYSIMITCYSYSYCQSVILYYCINHLIIYFCYLYKFHYILYHFLREMFFLYLPRLPFLFSAGLLFSFTLHIYCYQALCM
jgi:hypothetical protein